MYVYFGCACSTCMLGAVVFYMATTCRLPFRWYRCTFDLRGGGARFHSRHFSINFFRPPLSLRLQSVCVWAVPPAQPSSRPPPARPNANFRYFCPHLQSDLAIPETSWGVQNKSHRGTPGWSVVAAIDIHVTPR